MSGTAQHLDDAGRAGGPGSRSVRRRLARTAAAVLVAVLVLFAAGGWYYSGEIRKGALDAAAPTDPAFKVGVLAVGDHTVTLARDPDSPPELTAGDVWGIQWRHGYGQVGAVQRLEPDRVVRSFTRLSGASLRAGDRVGLDSFAFPSDPQVAFGIRYDEVSYASDLGPTPAWFVKGTRPTWVLFVHGYNAPRREALRLLAPVVAQGFPALVIAYRNDPGAPRSADGLRHWGQAEWRDVEGATAYALAHGASEVVLVGYSMGGGVVTSFLYESRLAGKVRGVILDAPGLSLDAAIDHGARNRKLPLLGTPVPAALTSLAEGIAGVRYHLDWDRLDYVDRADRLPVPVLLFHGTDDPRLPIAPSQALAAARPDLVRFVPVAGAGHVKSWNYQRARYEQEVRAFLDRVARPAVAARS
jgi:pimeloyl-ACP methyl ester carboxylesterase